MASSQAKANEELKEPFKRISVEEAKKMVERGKVQVVDVRQAGEYVTGHIKGSVLIPVNDLFGRIGEVSEQEDVLFVCAVGVRSALAAEIGAAMGRTKVFNVEGGMEAWKAKGYPVELGGASPH